MKTVVEVPVNEELFMNVMSVPLMRYNRFDEVLSAKEPPLLMITLTTDVKANPSLAVDVSVKVPLRVNFVTLTFNFVPLNVTVKPDGIVISQRPTGTTPPHIDGSLKSPDLTAVNCFGAILG